MHSAPGDSNLGNFIAWDAGTGKIVWSDPERFSVWSGALATAGNVVFYGTLEGYLKAVDMKTGKELYRFKTPSGWRLGWYWPGSWLDQTYRGSRHRRRVSESVELYPARGHSHGVRTTLTGPSTLLVCGVAGRKWERPSSNSLSAR
jgi:outer membrane protein assembly factor BamB